MTRLILPAALGALAAIALVMFLSGGGLTSSQQRFGIDPGASDEERARYYSTASAQTSENQATFNREFIGAGVRLDELDRVPSLVSHFAPLPGLEEPVAGALAVVRGTVITQELVTLPGRPAVTRITSTVAVTDHLKPGVGAESLIIQQPGTPSLREGGMYVLEIDEGDPPVRVGEDVIVYLGERFTDGSYGALSFKLLTVVDGLVRVNAGDVSLAPYQGAPVDDVLRLIRVAVLADQEGSTPVGEP